MVERFEHAVDTHDRRRAGHQVQVAGLALQDFQKTSVMSM